MSNNKYVINATDEQLQQLKNALHVGSPLDVALKFARIDKTTFYYWVSIASVVKYCKEQDYLKNEEKNIKSGVSMSYVKESVQEANKRNGSYKSTIDAFVEPTPESIVRYRTNMTYKAFADKIYDIINECDSLRSEIVLYHLTAIRDAARKKGGNAVSSQWFLERTLPEYFGRQDFGNNNNESNATTQPITVKFVSPNTKETQDRIKNMEAAIMNETRNAGNA